VENRDKNVTKPSLKSNEQMNTENNKEEIHQVIK
jgi:hypothetical protein